MRFIEAVTIWLAQKKASTRLSYERRIMRCVNRVGKDLPLDKITVGDIHRYAEELKAYRFEDKEGKLQTYSPTTLREEIKTVHIFFNWCVEKELIDKSPARLVELPLVPVETTRDKAMTDKDLEVLLAFTQNMPREHALVRFISETACRRGEVCSVLIANLKLAEPQKFYDVYLKQNVEIYTTLVGGKTGEREVGFYKTAAQALRRWILRRPICEHDFLFTTNKRKPLSPDYADQILRRLAKEIEDAWGYKMNNWNIHAMRHRIGHAMGDIHTPLPLISTKLGHRSQQTTMIYLPKDFASAWSRAAMHTVNPVTPNMEEEDASAKIITPNFRNSS